MIIKGFYDLEKRLLLLALVTGGRWYVTRDMWPVTCDTSLKKNKKMPKHLQKMQNMQINS